MNKTRLPKENISKTDLPKENASLEAPLLLLAHGYEQAAKSITGLLVLVEAVAKGLYLRQFSSCVCVSWLFVCSP